MRILIIDDEPLIGQSVGGLLERLGHQASYTMRTTAALEILRTEPVDVALVDWNMPEGGGGRIMAAVAAGEVPPVPLVVITGMPGIVLPAGMEGCPILQKPFRINQLVEILQALPPRQRNEGESGPCM